MAKVRQRDLDIAFGSGRKDSLTKLLEDIPILLQNARNMNMQNAQFMMTMDQRDREMKYSANLKLLADSMQQRGKLEDDLSRLTSEASGLGYTYQKLSKVSDDSKTSDSIDISNMTMQDLTNKRNNVLDQIELTEANIDQANSEIAAYKEGAQASRDFETNLQPGLQPSELSEYYGTVGEDIKSKFTYEGEDQSQERVASAFGLGATKPDPQTMSILKKEAIAKASTKVIPLSKGIKDYKEPKAAYLDASYQYGQDVINKTQELTAHELHAKTKDPNVAYFDEITTMFDYGDIDTFKREVIEEAFIMLEDPVYMADVGLSEAMGVGTEYEGYNHTNMELKDGVIQFKDGYTNQGAKDIIRYLNNYTQNAMIGLNANTNFTIRDQSAVTKLRASDILAKKAINEDMVAAFKTAPKTVATLLLTVEDDETVIKGGDSKIKQISKDLGIPKADVQSIILQLAESADPISLATVLSKSKNAQAIIVQFAGGKTFLETYMKITLPGYTASQSGDYPSGWSTKTGIKGLKTFDQKQKDILDMIKGHE